MMHMIKWSPNDEVHTGRIESEQK